MHTIPSLMSAPDEDSVVPSPPADENRLTTWRQFWVGLCLMVLWPVAASVVYPLGSADDYLIYLLGFLWTTLWDPIAAAQGALNPPWQGVFTVAALAVMALMWLTVAALPLLGRWPGKQAYGLWALQFSYAGAQAIAGYFYVQEVA